MYGRALTTGSQLSVLHHDGSSRPLPVRRYRQQVDEVDRCVVARCNGLTLDVGCGPGRFVSALMTRGVPALGVDIAPQAVAAAHAAGANVLRRSVFDLLPHEGAWSFVLLLDENIGIGGSPERLLRRVRALLAPRGQALVEVDADDRADDRAPVRLLDEMGRTSGPFPWPRLGTDAVMAVAAGAGLSPSDRWTCGGRRFVSLACAGARAT